MMVDTENRMEMSGPYRRTLKELLNDDRKIVAHIFMTCCIKVLEKDYGWNEDQVKEFHSRLQREIKEY